MTPGTEIYFRDVLEIACKHNKEISIFIEEKLKEITQFVNERYTKMHSVKEINIIVI
jgi:hypothetical protein